MNSLKYLLKLLSRIKNHSDKKLLEQIKTKQERDNRSKEKIQSRVGQTR